MRTLVVLFTLLLPLSSTLQANEEAALNQAYAAYKQALASGDTKNIIPLAKTAYDEGKNLLDADDEILFVLADNYATQLVKAGKSKTAKAVYQELINTNEDSDGRYGKALIAPLNALETLEAKSNPSAAAALKQRTIKLFYRHNPDQIMASVSEGSLASAAGIASAIEDVAAVTQQNYVVLEGQHWSILHAPGAAVGADRLNQQLEIAYRSIRSYLIAANFTSKPLEQKQLAIFFPNETDYRQFITQYDLHNRSGGSYEEKYGAMLMFDREEKLSDWKFYKKTNIVAREATQQIVVAAKIIATERSYYPYWVYDGLAYSFEFNDIAQPFGPHTDNLSATNWSRAQDLVDQGNWVTLKKLIRLSTEDEKLKENKEVIYIQGTYFLRFLYEYYADEFIEYLTLLPQQKSTKQSSASREKVFKKAFGDPNSLEDRWRRYMTMQGIVFP